MLRHGLSTVRICVGALAGLALWSVWQMSARTAPELESVNDRYQMSVMLDGGNATRFIGEASPVFVVAIHPNKTDRSPATQLQRELLPLISKIESAKPAVIGIAADLRELPTLCELQAALKAKNNIVVGYFGNARDVNQASKELCGYEQFGHMEFPRELGDVVYLMPRTAGNVRPFCEAIVSRFRNTATSSEHLGGSSLAMNLMYRPGITLASLPAQRFCRVNLAGEPRLAEISMSDALKNMAGKIVLIGIDDESGATVSPRDAALFFQADAIDTLVNGAWRVDCTRALNPAYMFFFVIACSTLFAILSPAPRFVVWLTGCVLSGIAAIICFDVSRTILPFGGPLLLFHCCYFAGTIINLETTRIEKNRKLAAALQQQLEDERKRIATDMHDEVLPALSRVMRLSDRLKQPEDDESIPAEIRSKLESTVTEMRKVINNLYPPLLDNLGLILALEHLVRTFSVETGIKSSFAAVSTSEDDLDLPAFYKLSLYRIVQEALNNVEKHSGASEIAVSIQKEGKVLKVQVADNGRGYELRQALADSRGLQIIQQRALAIGANIRSKKPSQFPSGTALHISVSVSDNVEIEV